MVVDDLLAYDWDPAIQLGREVPEPEYQDDCVVSTISASTLVIYLIENWINLSQRIVTIGISAIIKTLVHYD